MLVRIHPRQCLGGLFQREHLVDRRPDFSALNSTTQFIVRQPAASW